MNILKNFKIAAALSTLAFLGADSISAQSFMNDIKRDSARSDKLTGGQIAKTTLKTGEGNVKITINVPSFQMTLWQNGKEVKLYNVGVGMKEYPIIIGQREARQVIWNPDWIPPDSDWVAESPKVKAGEVVKASDPRNPLGKVKIPLGFGYLIHQAKGISDLGSLVSHGCVRVMRPDLYDLSDKIAAAYDYPVSMMKIENAKRTKNTVIAELEKPLPVDITYDTLVIENGYLSIYPDVYGHKKNTAKNLRDELESSGINTKKITDADLERILAKATGKTKFVVSVENIKAGKETSGGKTMPVLTRPTELKKKASPSPLGRRRIAD
jgi:L,D-transpeptidase catalytic domain